MASLQILSCLLPAGSAGAESHPEVLVLVNPKVPISVAIGEYYRAARGIPASNVVELPINVRDPGLNDARDETISRDGFDKWIRAPVERFLTKNGLVDQIEIIVLTHGLPFRAAGPSVPPKAFLRASIRASVDAELAVLFSELVGSPGVVGSVNPYLGSSQPFREWRSAHPEAPLRYLVARLASFPSPVDAGTGVPVDLKRQIDRARERAGSATWVVDESPNIRSGRREANRLLLTPAAANLRALGLPVLHETSREAAKNVDRVAGFATWGSNGSGHRGPPFYGPVKGNVYPGRFVPRSIVVPFVSTNARSFAQPPEYGQSLAPDLIRLGASGVAGHVLEPGLVAVPRAHIMLRAYAQGTPAVEAFYRSVPYLGWTHVYLGDPLMRFEAPVKATPADLDGDGVENAQDNCVDLPNPDQRDSNGDGYGNLCDADVNGDGRVTTSWGRLFPPAARGDVEAIAVTAQLGPYDPDHDLDGNGKVDAVDIHMAQLVLFLPPGPRGR